MQIAESLTPMMQQYFEIRGTLPPRTLLFFRLGDFYELFNDDAKIAARLLGITLTHRGSAPMAGVPYHSVTSYINKLLGFGYKIAICDQNEVPKPGKLVKRSLTRILTPGTAIDEQQIDAVKNQYMLALAISKHGLSMAWLEASTGDFQAATNIDPTKLLPVAFAIHPSEIIIPENNKTAWSRLPTNVQESLNELISNHLVSELPDFYFDQHHGADILREGLHVLHFDGFGFNRSDYPALGPAGALFHYAEENFRQRPKNITKVTLYRPQEHMQIDQSTMRNLEIFYNVTGQRAGSLLQSINGAVTPSGARQLELFLMEPCLDRSIILSRQNTVRAFVEQCSLREQVISLLKETSDIARILTRMQNRMRNPRELRAIQITLSQIPTLKQLLEESHVIELQRLSGMLSSCEDISSVLKEALSDVLPTDITEGGAIKAGYDTQLDEWRDLSTNAKEWINSFECSEQARTGIKSLKVKYNNTFGYFIEVTKSNLHLVPDDYVRRQTTVNGERYITEALRKKETEIFQSQSLAIEREILIFNDLIERVLSNFDALAQNAKVLAELDVYVGWGIISKKHNYCCPKFTDEDCLVIKDGRHPVVEQQIGNGFSGFVPNGVDLQNDDNQIALITGPNMAGKSTYIRQVALIAILAHIGCWVPARSCKLSIIDRVFSRIGSGDDLSRGRSTFMMEMSETANILHHATSASLVILDEVGRGTSTYDGLSIAWAVVEYLHGKCDCGPKTLFATHYHELTRLAQTLPRLKNFQMEITECNNDVVFLRKVIPGAADKSYGIHVAQLAGMPRDVIVRAGSILKELEEEGTVFAKKIRHNKQYCAADDSFQIALF